MSFSCLTQNLVFLLHLPSFREPLNSATPI